MRLRTFLVRRSVHTVITLVIVLVLLFVIFRLMPGDPTRFFIRPGQTPEDVAELRVSLGFAHREPAPGNGYRGFFAANPEGTYEISFTVADALGRSEEFYFGHTKQLSRTGPRVEAEVEPASGPMWAAAPGDPVEVRARLLGLPASRSSEVFDATAVVTSDGAPVTSLALAPPVSNGSLASTAWTLPDVGAYSLTLTFTSQSDGSQFVGWAGASANPEDPAPFQLVEEGIFAGWVSDQHDRANMTINVTSSGSSIRSVNADILLPDPSAVPNPVPVQLFHPLIVVDNNVLEEFWAYMTSMLVGDFGQSLYTRRAVWDEIADRVGPSLLLFGSAVVISYLLGILIGAVLAWRRGSKMELSAIVVSLFFYSMPVFWFGLILLWAFAFTLDIFPSGRFADVDAVQAGGLTYVLNVMWHMALPLLNLVILGLAGHVLLMRNSMLEVMGEDYITTAKAKGLSERRVMYRHAARNAMLPVVTAFALSISGTISGGVLTETIFSWPGMGAFLVQSTIQQDFPSVQGAFFLLAVLTILANLVADVLYAYLDPRVRL